jgi:hypothetical protein
MKRKRRRASSCVELQRWLAAFPLSLWKYLDVPHIHTPQNAAQSRLANAELWHLIKSAWQWGCSAAEMQGDGGRKIRSFYLSNRYSVVLGAFP